MKYFQLIFLFVIIIDSIYSLAPKKDKYELPIIPNKAKNRTKNANRIKSTGRIVAKSIREGNYRYFIYDTSYIKKPYRGPNFLYFNISSPEMGKTFIRYSFLSESMSQLDLNNISNNKINNWISPNSIIKLPNENNNKIFNYYITLNYLESDKSKNTLIIKVISPKKTDNITCTQINDIMNPMKNKMKQQMKDMNYNRPHYDIEYKDRTNSHNKKMRKRIKKMFKHGNDFRLTVAIILASIWHILLLLYCLVNRKRKNFVVLLKNSNTIDNLAKYRNI